MAWLIFDQYDTIRSQLLCDRPYPISVPSLHSRLKRRSEWQTLTWRRHFDKENLEHQWNSGGRQDWELCKLCDTWVRWWCLCLSKAGSSPGSWWSLSSTDTRAWDTSQTLWLFQVTMIMPRGHALYCPHKIIIVTVIRVYISIDENKQTSFFFSKTFSCIQCKIWLKLLSCVLAHILMSQFAETFSFKQPQECFNYISNWQAWVQVPSPSPKRNLDSGLSLKYYGPPPIPPPPPHP